MRFESGKVGVVNSRRGKVGLLVSWEQVERKGHKEIIVIG